MDEITNRSGRIQHGDQSSARNIHVNNASRPHMPYGSHGARNVAMPVQARMAESHVVQRNKAEAIVHTQDHGMKKDSRSDTSRAMNILDIFVTWCIFMLFFGLPLFFVNVTYQGVNFEKQYYFYLWSFLGIVALIARGMLGGRIEIRRTPLDIPLAVLWVSVLISTIFSVDKYHSVFGFFDNPVSGLVSITALILTYYLVVSHISKKRIMLLWWTIVASGGIVTVWSFMATMRFVPQKVLDHVIASLTGSFSSLAIFLGMLVPIFIISFAVIKDDVRGSVRAKIVAFFIIVFVALDIFTLSTLYGYVRWLIILAAMAMLLVFFISRSVKVSQSISTFTIITFLVLFGLMSFGQPIVTRTAIQTEAMIDYSLSLKVATQAFKSRPIFGSGPSTYGYDFSLYRPKDLNKTGRYDLRFFSDRGVFLESVSTLGIVGVVALIIILLTYINTVLHAFMRSKDEEIKVISLGLFVASFIMIVYGAFWAVDGAIILYGVLMSALLMGILRNSLGEGSDSKLVLSTTASPQYALSFAFLSILVAVGVIFGFVTLGKMFVADVHAGNALRARSAGDFERSSVLFQKAVTLNGQEGRYYTVISQYGLDLANVESAKPEGERNDENVKTYITGSTGTASVGRNLMPNDVLANETKGFVFENSGGYVSDALYTAMDAYAKAQELEPQNPYLDVAIGKLKLVEAQSKADSAVDEKKALINEAKGFFESARDKTTFDYNGKSISGFAPAHYYISVVEEALGNVDAAIDAMTTALQVTVAEDNSGSNQQQVLSRQINYGFNLARLLQVRGTEGDMKNAENLLVQIIGINDQEVNSHLNLGLLYEQTNRKDQAIEEYKKILAILSESDTKARENIQKLIDTVEQGGSNVDKKSDTGTESEETTEADQNKKSEEKPTVLVVKANEGNDAQGINDLLAQDGYGVDMREEDGRMDTGIVVMYKSSIDSKKVKSVEDALKKTYDAVTTMKNDQEVSVYDYDIVIVVGKTGTSEIVTP
ncbi:MAG: hypothetical protein WC819_06280 [Parcubacteria group bacterium]|jgi:tetratricopeptide (TPR) repeat protein